MEKEISATRETKLYGINSNNVIYSCEKPCDSGNWVVYTGSTWDQLTGEIDVTSCTIRRRRSHEPVRVAGMSGF